ncbi:C40 family peptidase [Nocardia altamirensis]|uniref:C40 family peptidase n=1 Tax=Nocardia altamirensis TaxID=472158 RepID=UPI0008404343|nr:NlpC/P60 family protein [Nocardia altamirensis]
MTDEVEALLQRLRASYGDGAPVRGDADASAEASTVADQLRANDATTTTMSGQGVRSYTTTAHEQIAGIEDLADRDDAAGQIVDSSATDTTSGRTALDATTGQYLLGRAVVAPVTRTPAGALAMLKLKHGAVSEGASVLTRDSQYSAARAALVRQLAAEYIRRVQPMTGPMTMAAGAGMGIPATMASSLGSPVSALMASAPVLRQSRPRAQSTPGPAGLWSGGNAPALSTGGAAAGTRVVDAARGALRLPYVWGGGSLTGPTGGGYDCSGLTRMAVYQATGGHMELPRTTYDQIKLGQRVAPGHEAPGDLVFSNFSARGPEHVQIYAGKDSSGNAMVIEAQQSGVPVKYSPYNPAGAVVKRVVE